MYKKFVAIDQYGNTEFVNHPRKELTERNGVTPSAAQKMYIDTKDGETKHVGYVVSGHWYEVMKISPMND